MSAAEIEQALRRLGDPATARHAQVFFQTGAGQYGAGDRFLGIRVPELRTQAKRYSAAHLRTCLSLLKSRYHEIRLLALFMLIERFQRADAAGRARIYHAYLRHTQYINNWDLVDSSASKILGVYLQDKDKKVIYKLARSRSLWERRIAVLSTLHWIKNQCFDDALKICEMLLDDREDLIHKATGWMLREIGNRDKTALYHFLQQHSTNMPRTMLRYAIEKLPERKRRTYLGR